MQCLGKEDPILLALSVVHQLWLDSGTKGTFLSSLFLLSLYPRLTHSFLPVFCLHWPPPAASPPHSNASCALFSTSHRQTRRRSIRWTLPSQSSTAPSCNLAFAKLKNPCAATRLELPHRLKQTPSDNLALELRNTTPYVTKKTSKLPSSRPNANKSTTN